MGPDVLVRSMDEQNVNRIFHVKALETQAVVSENKVDTVLEQVHALTQEAGTQQEAARNQQDAVSSLETLRCTDLQRMQDVLLALTDKGAADA